MTFAHVRPIITFPPYPFAVDGRRPSATTEERFSRTSARTPGACRISWKDPHSTEGDSPTLFATDRTDRVTYVAQGWKVTDPQVRADVGPMPDHETLIGIPEEVLKYYARRYQQEKAGDN